MKQTPTISRRQDAIENAAIQAFARYGYRRTSMEDIAQASGISRAALYLHFRNKEDIFRSIAAHFFEKAIADMTASLELPGLSAEEALRAAFAAKDGDLMELVFSSAHGDELLDTGFSVSADIVAEGEAKVQALLAGWLAARSMSVDFGPYEELAHTIVAAMKGLKTNSKNYAEYQTGQRRLARLIGRAIS